jgi:hypothetical protein
MSNGATSNGLQARDLAGLIVLSGLLFALSGQHLILKSEVSVPGERRAACEQELINVYRLVKQNPKRIEGWYFHEPSPFLLTPSEHYCPVVDFLTRGRTRSPFLLTYAVQWRDSGKWEAVDLDTPPNVPLVFVSEAFGQGGRQYEGRICYSDGSTRVAALPVFSWPISENRDFVSNIVTLEIPFCKDDPRFPYAEYISAIRCQYLGKKP